MTFNDLVRTGVPRRTGRTLPGGGDGVLHNSVTRTARSRGPSQSRGPSRCAALRGLGRGGTRGAAGLLPGGAGPVLRRFARLRERLLLALPGGQVVSSRRSRSANCVNAASVVTNLYPAERANAAR